MKNKSPETIDITVLQLLEALNASAARSGLRCRIILEVDPPTAGTSADTKQQAAAAATGSEVDIAQGALEVQAEIAASEDQIAEVLKEILRNMGEPAPSHATILNDATVTNKKRFVEIVNKKFGKHYLTSQFQWGSWTVADAASFIKKN